MSTATANFRIENTRFGKLELRADQILNFTSPMVGFETLRRFAVLPNLDCPPFIWLQSLEDAEIAFPVVDPRHLFPDYEPELPSLQSQLGEGPYLTLCVICKEDGRLGLNLLAPIVVSGNRENAAQIVLNRPGLTTFRSIED